MQKVVMAFCTSFAGADLCSFTISVYVSRQELQTLKKVAMHRDAVRTRKAKCLLKRGPHDPLALIRGFTDSEQTSI